ncbi:hypothetical protein [Olivibacter jilunii]|uniref:hypothetical protein n=1 Tax=Olivibacter jilunii TaxID=985016 RepID=UPI003F15A422
MKRKEVISFLLDIEQKYPVQSWKIGDIDMWPVFKMDVFFRWYKTQNNSNEAQKDMVSQRRGNRITRFIWSAYAVLKFKFRKHVKLGNVYCGSEAHRIEYKGAFINRYFWPFISESSEDDYLELEYGAQKVGKSYPNSDRLLFVDDYYLFYYFLNLFNKRVILTLPNYKEVKEEVEKKIVQLPSRYSAIMYSRYKAIYIYSKIFKMIFKKYKPENVYGLCYYNNAMFGMHCAANSMSINNIDMQHGGQGPLHPMYNFREFDLQAKWCSLPKVFWCWDEASHNQIKKWIDKSQYHSSVNGGNPWISYILESENTKKITSNKRIILYTLQEPSIDSYIIETIKHMSRLGTYCWWLRLHPRMISSGQAIKDNLLSHGLTDDAFEIEKASAYPLPLILANSVIHVSKYSGSIIEAVQLKVPTMIIDEIGVESFGHYIESGDAVDATSKNPIDLITIIGSLDKKVDI